MENPLITLEKYKAQINMAESRVSRLQQQLMDRDVHINSLNIKHDSEMKAFRDEIDSLVNDNINLEIKLQHQQMEHQTIIDQRDQLLEEKRDLTNRLVSEVQYTHKKFKRASKDSSTQTRLTKQHIIKEIFLVKNKRPTDARLPVAKMPATSLVTLNTSTVVNAADIYDFVNDEQKTDSPARSVKPRKAAKRNAKDEQYKPPKSTRRTKQ
jgi:hypothetical protein